MIYKIFFQLTESIQDTMTETLVENYGVELHDDFNRAVTKAWDKAQEKVKRKQQSHNKILS